MDTSKGWTPSVPSPRACDRSLALREFLELMARRTPDLVPARASTSLINYTCVLQRPRHQTYARGGFCHGLLRQGKSDNDPLQNLRFWEPDAAFRTATAAETNT